MSSRPVIVLLLAVALGLCAGALILMVVPSPPEPVPEAPQPSAPWSADTERREHLERFFSGDPDRDVRSGQEMKPRW